MYDPIKTWPLWLMIVFMMLYWIAIGVVALTLTVTGQSSPLPGQSSLASIMQTFVVYSLPLGLFGLLGGLLLGARLYRTAQTKGQRTLAVLSVVVSLLTLASFAFLLLR